MTLTTVDEPIFTTTTLSTQLSRIHAGLREMLDLVEATSPGDPRHMIAVEWAAALAQTEKDLLKAIGQP